jgi:hypothetical protein
MNLAKFTPARSAELCSAVSPNSVRQPMPPCALYSLCFLLFIVVSLPAADTNSEPQLDGLWKWSFTMPDGTKADPKARLKREGDTLTGTSTPRPGMSIPIIDGKIDGDKITWTILREAAGRKVTTRYEGVVKGDTIKGSINSDWAGETRRYDWSAKRAPHTPTGTWTWETVFGTFRSQSSAKLELDSKGKLKGKAKLRTTEVDIKNAHFKDGEVSFDVVRERDGVETVTTYRGKLDGDTIKGESEFEFGGELRKREWVATREDE